MVDNVTQSGPGQDRQTKAKPKTVLCDTGLFNEHLMIQHSIGMQYLSHSSNHPAGRHRNSPQSVSSRHGIVYTWHCICTALSICGCRGTEKAQQLTKATESTAQQGTALGQTTRLSPLSCVLSVSVTHRRAHRLPLVPYETRLFSSPFSLSHLYCTNNYTFAHIHTHVVHTHS